MVESIGGEVESVPQLTIRSPEAIRLIRELAALEGRSMTAVVGDAVREKYMRDYPAAFRESRITYWLERGQQLRETWSG
jgi:hypothetical protein